MKIKSVIVGLLIASIFLPGLVAADSNGVLKISNTTTTSGQIPKIGDISTPSTTTDVTSGLGIFADMGTFIMDYSVQIAIFAMVLISVLLSIRGSFARGNNKPEEAADIQKNQKGLILDGIITLCALLFIFCIFAPFVRSLISV